MTQESRPQADNLANYPTGDSGPYSGDDWALLFQVLFTGDQQQWQGPLMNYFNELLVATAAGDITVDTGAGFCNGHWLHNSALVTFSPSHAIRTDKVVMVENNTNLTYSTNLEFPTVLTDYNLTASVEPYSCRLAILTGIPGGAARSLITTGPIYMVELARYDIIADGTVSNLIDFREFCQFSTFMIKSRTGFTPCINTQNPGPTWDWWGSGASVIGVPMDDGVDSDAFGAWQVPADFKANLVCETAVEGDGTGNMWARCILSYQACGEAVGTHTVTPALAAEGITAGDMECVYSESLAAAAIGDVITIRFNRVASHANDTVDAEVRCIGWIFTYDALV